MTRVQTAQTQRDIGLERHPTALSRIATQRSQRNAALGAGLKPRVPVKPLPEFGAGKSYPPHLPEKEDYVVGFAGPDDPLYPQNWPTKK
jgi:DHA1 family multidrug resistance protein-like MFS transporter